jgi:glycosyl transferase family 25
MSDQTFDSGFDCYVINLKTQPDKLTQFLAHNGPALIIPFEAIDGTKVSVTTMFEIFRPYTAHYPAGTIGNSLSHRALWHRCAEQEKNFLVFEDDAVVRHDIKAMLVRLLGSISAWDIVLLGYNFDSVLDFRVTDDIDFGGTFSELTPTPEQIGRFSESTETVALLRLNVALGTCAYAVSPIGARNLTRTCFPMDNRPVPLRVLGRSVPAFGIDCMMAVAYRNLRAFVCVPPLAMTPNDWTVSTTGRKADIHE